MKLNLPAYRPSGPLPPKGSSSGLRRSHVMQRAAGKMFHQWAEVGIYCDNFDELNY